MSRSKVRISGFVRVVAVLGILLAAACASEQRSAGRHKDPLSRYQLGRVYFAQNRVKEAFEEINAALRGDPSLPQIWFYRGYMYWTLKDWTHAEQDFRTTLDRNPFYTDARMYLAICLEEQGHPDQALAELDRAAEDRTFATPEQIFLNKAVILRRQARLDEALLQLRTAVTLRPRFYRGHYEMAQVLGQLGRFEESDAAFAAAEPGYSKDAEFHYLRGEALFKMRRQEDAARELRRALALGPGSEAAEKASQLLKQIN